MRGEFPKVIKCWIFGHDICKCDFCKKHGTLICKRCDGDL